MREALISMKEKQFRKFVIAGIAVCFLIIVFYVYRKLAVYYDYENLITKGRLIEGDIREVSPFQGRLPGKYRVTINYKEKHGEPRTLKEVWRADVPQAPRPGETVRLYYYDDNGFIKASTTANVEFPQLEKRS